VSFVNHTQLLRACFLVLPYNVLVYSLDSPSYSDTLRVWAEERAGRRVAGLVARLLCERLPALLAIYAPNAASPEVTTAAQLVRTSVVAVATRAKLELLLLGQPTRATATRPAN
jgi:hypothetical protein